MPEPLFSERAATASATREPPTVVPERTAEPVASHEAMRALASAVGNRTFAAQLSPVLKRTRIEQALAERDPTLLLPVDDFSALTHSERLSLIQMCLDQGGGQWQYAFVLGMLWNSLGPDALGPFGRDNWDVWLRSLDAYPGLADLASVQALKERFRDDVRKEIVFRLDGSERIVKAETARLEALAESQRSSDAYDLVAGADAYSRLLEAQQALVRLRVRGYRLFQVPNETRTGVDWRAAEATFDPSHPPQDRGSPSEPGYDPFEGLPTWEEVAERYGQVAAAMQELGEAQPVLYAAARRDKLHEIVAAAGADQTPKEIFEIALEPLYAIALDIERTRADLGAGDADPLDFGPIVQGIRFGRVVSDSRTPWGDLFYRWVTAITVGDHSTNTTAATELALGALTIVAAFIPGAELVVEGLQIALVITAIKDDRAAWDLADALEAAEGAALRPGEDLVAPGAAAAAHAKAVAADIFLFIAALPYAARFAELALVEDVGGAALGTETRSAATEAGPRTETPPPPSSAVAEGEESWSRVASSTGRTTRFYRQRTPRPEYARGGASAESLAPSEAAAEDIAQASSAQQSASEKGAATPGKTTSVTQRQLAPGVTARRTEVSGWKPIPERDVAVDPQVVREHAEEIGHQLRPAGALDQLNQGGFRGKYYASHAEKQQIVARPNEPVGVSRPMCDDCIRFFQREAAYQGRPITVSDPQTTRVFSPDGSITEHWKDGSIVRLDAGGSTRAQPGAR